MATHELKTDREVFQAMLKGLKPYDIRYNDRDFKVGDVLTQRETVHTGEEMKPHHDGAYPGATIPGKPLLYTGEEMETLVTHILHGPIYGLMPGWVIMSVEIIDSGVVDGTE